MRGVEPSPPELALEDLERRFRHIPPSCGSALAQAAVLCLEGQGHASGVLLSVAGTFTATYRLRWTMDVTEAMRRYWNDPDETAEEGAYAVALLVMRALLGFTVVERACKKTGFDWWLGPDNNRLEGKARLEVSGIMHGTTKQLNSRVKAKLTQTERSDASGLPAYAFVVEFGWPRAKVVRR
jgi:hypothetical protein